MRKLESNRFTMTKFFVAERMKKTGRKWNRVYKRNRGMNIISPVKKAYYDFSDIHTQLASLKHRRY